MLYTYRSLEQYYKGVLLLRSSNSDRGSNLATCILIFSSTSEPSKLGSLDTMDLSNEIILQILKSLGKSDLKSARLVSKTWSVSAAEFLFHRAYVSVHPENLEVFNAITQHPLLSKCVKTLKYDMVEFIDLDTEEDYFQLLWSQTKAHLPNDVPKRSERNVISDPEIDTWVNLVASAPIEFNVNRPCELYRFIRRVCKNYRFIDCGYQKYRRAAALQRAFLNNGDFFEELIRGLQKLSSLIHVKMDDHWDLPWAWLHDPSKLLLKRPTGSPLARNWNSSHLCPQRNWVPHGLDEASQKRHVASHYWTIICALIRSQKSIQTFATGGTCDISLFCFDKSQVGLYSLDIVAFSGLKTLKLRITYDDKNTLIPYASMDGLRSLLGSMHHLESLTLSLPDNRPNQLLYSCEDIFPPQGRWSHLTSLHLDNFASSATDFLTLLTRAMPNLKDLHLSTIELLSGTWEGVLECMMQLMHLSLLLIYPDTEFLHCGGDKFLDEQESFIRDEIENYVVYGGRHPCLRPNQSKSAAKEYVTEELRQFYKTSQST